MYSSSLQTAQSTIDVSLAQQRAHAETAQNCRAAYRAVKDAHAAAIKKIESLTSTVRLMHAYRTKLKRIICELKKDIDAAESEWMALQRRYTTLNDMNLDLQRSYGNVNYCIFCKIIIPLAYMPQFHTVDSCLKVLDTLVHSFR